MGFKGSAADEFGRFWGLDLQWPVGNLHLTLIYSGPGGVIPAAAEFRLTQVALAFNDRVLTSVDSR